MNECVPKQFSEIRSGDQYRSKKHEAIAYCVRCGLCETVNESLIGQRFDCPRGAFDETHVAAVVFDKFWEVAWLRIAHWLALCEECRADLWRHNIELSIAVAIALPIFFLWLLWFLEAPGLCVIWMGRAAAAWVIVDALLYRSATAYGSQRPRSPLRTVVFAVAGFIALALAFGLIYATLPRYQFTGNLRSLLDPFTAAYFSLVTAATVGYGDVTPACETARVVAMCEIFCSIYYLAVLLAVMASWARGVDRTKTLGELLVESSKLDAMDAAWRNDGFEGYLRASRRL